MASPASLKPHQLNALLQMKNGCILNGGVGSGKSRTALAYYYTENGGEVNTPKYVQMVNPCDLYIITPANKRDLLDWKQELLVFNMYYSEEHPELNLYHNKVVIDSWNNIKKYSNVKNAMFIFDEQHVSGYGAWTKAFLKIAKSNKWILLSATPGDCWKDFIPVFIANGFYRNKTDFDMQHVVYARFVKFPMIERYINEGILLKHKKDIMVTMDFERKTIPHHITVFTDYDVKKYNYIVKNHWNIYKDTPIENASEYCLVLRRLVNSDNSRKEVLLKIVQEHPRAIIFYSYDYELEFLRQVFIGYKVGERNGHVHDTLPDGDKWVYLVQYYSGAESWNCVTADTTIFFSQNYSYRLMVQATGRTDRMNTPFTDLYYYHLKTTSKIDTAIHMALKRKEKFNEEAFAPKFVKDQKLATSSAPSKLVKNKIDRAHFKIEDYCEEHSSWKNPLT